MHNVLLALHLLAVVFTVGPLVGAAMAAARGLRSGDTALMLSAQRTVRIYATASIVVVLFGFGLMSTTDPDTHKATATFGETWIWLSLILWLVATGLALGVLAPALKQAAGTSGDAMRSLTGRVAGSGGVIALLYAAIIVLMVFQPGG